MNRAGEHVNLGQQRACACKRTCGTGMDEQRLWNTPALRAPTGAAEHRATALQCGKNGAAGVHCRRAVQHRPAPVDRRRPPAPIAGNSQSRAATRLVRRAIAFVAKRNPARLGTRSAARAALHAYDRLPSRRSCGASGLKSGVIELCESKRAALYLSVLRRSVTAVTQTIGIKKREKRKTLKATRFLIHAERTSVSSL